jgi:hypothetical protein
LSLRAITELLANIFREAGVTETDIKGDRMSLKRLAAQIGTAELEAGTIIEYQNRLKEAYDDIMVRLTSCH